MIRVIFACLLACPLPVLAQQHVHTPDRAAVTMDSGLGEISFPNSGAPAAQADFLRGLLLLHSFEFDSARQAFLAAQRADPGFALAYWGEALSYNKPVWNEQDLVAARSALAKLAPTATQRIAKAPTQREKDYLAAVEKLYGDGEKTVRDAAYSAALEAMARKYPDDLDARSLYSLSLLGLTGAARSAVNYMRAAAEAEAVYEIDKRHPGALHYLIHAYDDPVHAPLGLRAARLYGKLAPAASHAQHMPSHIFFALGMWDDAISSNIAALKTARDQGHGGYHALHWLMYAYLQQDRRDEAAALLAMVADDVRRKPDKDNRSALAAARATWLFETKGAGAPQQLRAALDSSGIRSIAAFASYDFARGAVAAGNGDLDSARDALQSLRSRIDANRGAKNSATASRYDNVTADEVRQSEILATALEGALRFAQGERSDGIAHVRRAAESAQQMSFEYGPPWSVKPLAELLGEMLLQAGDYGAAASAFQASLNEHPNRRASVQGMARARAE